MTIPTKQNDIIIAAPRLRFSRRWLYLASLAAVWALTCLPRLTSPAIFDDSDGMYAEVPREMLLRGDWITPYANGLRYLEKPPLYYWLIAGSYRLFGVSAVAARFAVALVCLGIILACYALGSLLFDAEAGWIAGLTMATSAGYYLFTQQLMPDPLFTLLLALVFLGFLKGDREGRPRRAVGWHLFSFAMMGLAVLAKGLIGLVFPVLTLGAYVLLRWRAGRPVRLPLAPGLLVFAVVAVPWHGVVGVRNPGWAWFYFVNEHILRFLNQRVPRDYGTVPLAAFWLLHAVWLFPWSALLPLAIRDLWRASRGIDLLSHLRPAPAPQRGWAQRLWAVLPRFSDDGLVFAALWAGSVLLFFSFSTRLEYYSMPAFPAMALLIGGAGSRAARGQGGKPSRWLLSSLRALAAVATAMLLAALVLTVWAACRPPGHPRPLMDPDSPYSVYFFSPIFNLSLDQLRWLALPALGLTFSAFAGSWVAFGLARRGRATWAPWALVAAMIPSLASLHRCVLPFEDDLSSRGLAVIIDHHWHPGDRIVLDGLYETYNSLSFYTGQPLYILNARQGYLEYGSRYPDAPPLFLDRSAFARLLDHRGAGRVFVVTRAPERFPRQNGQPLCLRELGGKSLLVFGPLKE